MSGYQRQYGASAASVASDAGLHAHAQAPAGSRFSENAENTSQLAPGAQRGTSGPAAGKTTPFYKQRKFIICQLILIPLGASTVPFPRLASSNSTTGIVILFVLLFPVVKAIAQLVVNRSTLDIQTATITSPTNNSFMLALEGNVAHTGFIPATIQFQQPLNISWITSDGSELPMGYVSMSELKAHGKRAVINQTATPFTIVNETNFASFSTHLITDQNFTWRLSSENLKVQAAKFPVSKGIKFNKDIVMSGLNSFSGNVAIEDFQLPSDNPSGGINYVAITSLNNPSAFNLNLGTVVFALSYKNVSLGLGTSTDTIIAPGNNTVTLKGVLVEQNNTNDLAIVSELFTNYLNSEVSPVIATGQSTIQSDGSEISWLSSGLQALELTVPLVPPTPINPINTITIGSFDLDFSDENPWAPTATSNSVTAGLSLPFGFSLSIGEIQNSFNITMMDNTVVAGLSTPVGASTSQIGVYGPQNITGQVDISINNTALSCPDPQHAAFSTFNTDLTQESLAPFRLVGNSVATAKMAIGNITLNPIKVNVTTSLKGLQGLQGMVTIGNVDVQGGTTEGITLSIDVAINNPSNLKLDIGNLTLQLVRGGANLGTALIPDLVLDMGVNKVTSTSVFKANDSPQGLQTLDDFVGGTNVSLNIAGYSGSTDVASLAAAMQSLNVTATLPALSTQLLESAALKILSTTGVSNNISHVTVSLKNPFTTGLEITSVSSTVSAFGINLGTINSTTSFSNPGKQTTTSPELDLDMNFDPATLFSLTRRLAIEAGLSVAPLDAIVSLGGITYLPEAATSSQPISSRDISARDSNVFSGWDLPTFVQAAFKKLQSDVALTAGVTIGEYKTTLSYTQNNLTTNTDSSLDLILPILARPIVQQIVGGSALGLNSVLIKNPEQESFTAQLSGAITNAGPFNASIAFGGSGLTVAWNGAALGTMTMDPISVVADSGATLDTSSTFKVSSVDQLTSFTKTLITDESFDWAISGDNLTVSALGIQVSSITAAYNVSLKGFNGLKGGVTIQSFDLPENDPAGGIHLTINATAANPSQVGIELSSISFDTYANNTKIASVASGAVTLSPGGTTDMALAGRLLPQSSSEGLAVVSGIFNRFVAGEDSDVVVDGTGAGSSSVTWLNTGIQALQVATVLPNQGKLNVIKSIGLDQLKLVFTESTAYAPLASTDDTVAAFTLPFAFPIDITSLEQTINVGYKGNNVAQLVIPKGPATTDVDTRIIHITFDNVPFAAVDGADSEFNDFVADTTIGTSVTLALSGAANADASTAVGVLSLTNIDFSVSSSINGLQGLASKPVSVANLDVNHGYTDYLLITVDSALFNPSNLTIGTGDVSFNLNFQSQTVGTADLSNLVITPGNQSYSIDVHYAPQGSSATSAGETMLENFLQGIDSSTSIVGTTGSTPIQSLQEAMSDISLSPVTIPALHQNLIQSASIEFPTDIVQTGIAQASFVLANPFTASINVDQIATTATYNNLTLGTIKADVSSNPIHADGHSSVTSQSLPLDFNLDPVTIINLLTDLSEKFNVDLGPLTQLFEIVLADPTAKTTVTTSVDTNSPTCVSGTQFNINGAILDDLSHLEANLAVTSSLALDDYALSLTFGQNSVPVKTDDTALYLIGAVAAPVAQFLVNQADLAFTEANITNISDQGFDLSLKGSLTNIGPLDAEITFVDPLNVAWQGTNIAQITLPAICAAANTGVPNYNTNAHLTITDLDAFTSFATSILHNEEFTWVVSTPNLQLTALGTVFNNVALSKNLTFKAFNGLPGVTINNFQLPSDDPAGGITIDTGAAIPSPAQLGLDLGTVTFTSFFQGVEIGPLSATDLFLAPTATTDTHLTGRITPKSGSDLDTMGVLFSNYLAGKNQTLTVKGDTVQPDGTSGSVTWLSTAFQSLTLNVILPGQTFTLIDSISLNELALVMVNQDEAFAPLTSSSDTLATYKNPFGFSLQVIDSGENLMITDLGLDVATLTLPVAPVDAGVSTGNVADLSITFQNQPLVSGGDTGFELLLAVVLLTSGTSFELSGDANITARTTIGDVPITGIPFDVSSSIVGMNSFGNTATLSNVTVTGSGGTDGSEYIVSPLTATLNNPSNISLDTIDISLPVFYENVQIGAAVIDQFPLVPGEVSVASEFHYAPANANDTTAQSFLTSFIQGDSAIPLTIKGSADSSPFSSLGPALESLTLETSVQAMDQPTLITHINVYITLESLVTNLVSIDFDFQNPLDTEITILYIQSDSGVNNETYAYFQTPLDFVIPAHGTANSGTINNVLLTQGAVASLGLVAIGYLDVFAASTVQIGSGGYTVPWLQIAEYHVPTSYSISLTDEAMSAAVASISSSSVAATAKTTATSVAASLTSSDTAHATTTSSDSAKETTTAATTAKTSAETSPSTANAPEKSAASSSSTL
ncbi:hypothetical protein HMN09_01042200 [Mycena chlorophos]|uniref:Uncharacterized protein n=1 Tax=Mycena chlorophos TaxID=658473 RepID=A0A8H6W1I1_MYCCL|nr:hypothetical protein HMN09_01042200 [Mycena chlorophos]